MKRAYLYPIGALLLACIMAFGGCTKKPTDLADGGTGTETVIGNITMPDGSPAGGATVYLRGRDFLSDTTGPMTKILAGTAALAISDSAVTDSLGNYSFHSANPGIYVVDAVKDDTLKALIDSVQVLYSQQTLPIELATAQLQPVGSIAGIARMSLGDDPRNVYVLVYGVNRFVQPDSNGKFTVTKLAPGKYDLRFLTSLTGYQSISVSGVEVVTGKSTILDTISLPSGIVPASKVYNTIEALVQEYLYYATVGDSENALKNCLISESGYRDLVKDSTALLYKVGYDQTMYVVYDTNWVKDTITAADTSNSKYRIGSRCFIADSLKSYDALSFSHIDYRQDVQSAIRRSFTSLAQSLLGKQVQYLDKSYDDNADPLDSGQIQYGLDQDGNVVPFRASQIQASAYRRPIPEKGYNLEFTIQAGAGEIITEKMADMIVKTGNGGWKILFPAGVNYLDTISGIVNQVNWMEKPSNLVGLWSRQSIDETTGDLHYQRIQFNEDGSFAYTNQDLPAGRTVAGTYQQFIPNTIRHTPPLLVGQFAYRDSLDRWTLTPAGKVDTLRLGDSIINFDMVVSATLEDSIRVATWKIWALPPTDTVYESHYTNTIMLRFSDNGVNDSCFFAVELEGINGINSYDKLLVTKYFNWSYSLLGFGNMARETSVSDYELKELLRGK